ncbi:MAG: DUF4190 domain-containing protein [Clostridia bacterium]|nr:DUF4190 domain-containing protein [Clostridia bacterium]
MICNKCGAEVPEGAKFCPVCGASLEAAEEVKENVETVEAEKVTNGDFAGNDEEFDFGKAENDAKEAFSGDSVENSAKNYSIAALVLGLVGTVGSWIPIVRYCSFVAAILAIIFGNKARKMTREIYGQPNGMATAGFVLGIVAVGLSALAIACVCFIGGAALTDPSFLDALEGM